MTQEQRSFINLADQFLVEYSLPGAIMGQTIKLFLMGHAIELYLKAAYIKNFNPKTITGHDLAKVFKECKNADPLFMPEYDLKEAVLNPNYSIDEDSPFNEDDRHYLDNQDFYTLAKWGGHLKYFGTPIPQFSSTKPLQGSQVIATMFPNPYWIGFIKELRKYLDHPQEGCIDYIKYYLESTELPAASKDYLSGLYA